MLVQHGGVPYGGEEWENTRGGSELYEPYQGIPQQPLGSARYMPLEHLENAPQPDPHALKVLQCLLSRSKRSNS